MLDFPSSPSVGQRYPATPVGGLPVWLWDGEKWTTVNGGAAPTGSPPSDNDPFMNGAATPGVSGFYTRGDHVHPRDNTKAPVASPTLTGTTVMPALAASGRLQAASLNVSGASSFGSMSASGAMVLAGAVTMQSTLNVSGNATFGNVTMTNLIAPVPYGGIEIGSLTTANAPYIDFMTGGVGTAVDARIQASGGNASDGQGQLDFQCSSLYGPTMGNGDNSTALATTAYVQANPATGNYLPLSGGTITGNLVGASMLMPYRNGATGVIYLSNGDRYCYFDGTNYSMPVGALVNAAGRCWGQGDFGFPVSNARLALAGDYFHRYNSGMVEPYGGCCITGASGYANVASTGGYFRYRYMQFYTTGWYTVGYA